MKFIDQYAGHRSGGRRWGVESICAQLGELGAPIAPSTFYAARAAKPTPAQVRDEQLTVEVARVHKENYGVYGARKVWAQLNREGIPVARCTVERLMRAQGLVGARRGRRVRTTLSGSGWYWKVGAYVQSNSTKGDGAGSVGEVTVYSLNCVHA